MFVYTIQQLYQRCLGPGSDAVIASNLLSPKGTPKRVAMVKPPPSGRPGRFEACPPALGFEPIRRPDPTANATVKDDPCPHGSFFMRHDKWI